jgi:photosystem II stability/assembly factor-like uncharacterized protein
MLSANKISTLRACLLGVVICLSLPLMARAQPPEREPAFRDNFYDVAVQDRDSFIVGYYGTILHSGDRGASWTLQKSQTQEALFRVVFPEKNMGWVSGAYGTILHTRDGGKNWQKQATGTEEHLFGLHFLNSQSGWAVGSRGVILRTEDGGRTWVSASIGEDIILNDVRFLNPRQGWAVGEFGRIYHSRDGGRTWVKQKSPIEVSPVSGESRNLFRLLFGDVHGGWAFGLDGAILKTRLGERWELASPGGAVGPMTQRHHLFSAALFDGKKWAVGERGTVIESHGDNDSWQPAAIKVAPVNLNGIAFGADGLGFVVGNRGFLLRTENGGKGWEQMRISAETGEKGVSRSR